MIYSGIVIKAYSGYYYVQTADKVITCTLRGRFKKERFTLLVGDEVEYSKTAGGKGVIENILPRRSMLRRPMIANVDQVLLTFAAANPDINPVLVDRFLILAELSQLNIILCINKIDLADTSELELLCERYRQLSYEVVLVAAKKGVGIDKLRGCFDNHITVLAGPSGVGKSTILNEVEPGLKLVTGEVSEKIGRGKHTTRYAQLLPVSSGGFVVDTPGFSFTEFGGVDPTELADCFPEMAAVAPQCKFTTCLHDKEPQCAVKKAVQEGLITQERYASYLEVLAEIKENKKGF